MISLFVLALFKLILPVSFSRLYVTLKSRIFLIMGNSHVAVGTCYAGLLIETGRLPGSSRLSMTFAQGVFSLPGYSPISVVATVFLIIFFLNPILFIVNFFNSFGSETL